MTGSGGACTDALIGVNCGIAARAGAATTKMIATSAPATAAKPRPTAGDPDFVACALNKAVSDLAEAMPLKPTTACRRPPFRSTADGRR
jgi:hypothetical protein